MSETKIQLLVLQSTPYCNIACEYCYLPDRSAKSRMSASTLEKIFRNIFASSRVGEKLDVLWGGGEPLVLAPAYYEQALAVIKDTAPPAASINYYIQTNGTLLDDGWCDFLKTTGTNVNISLDGPKEIHDANRVGHDGQSTFSATMAGIRCLQRHGIDFTVTSVLSSVSLDKAKELHEFYKTENIDKICFSVEEIKGPHARSSLLEPDQEAQFRNFMRAFWNLSVDSKTPHYIREFNEMFQNIVNPPDTNLRNILVEPLAVISVDWEGNFATFSPEFLGQKNQKYQDFVIGSVETGIDAALNSTAFKELSADVRDGVEICRNSCGYFPLCGGGSPINKLYENGAIASSETMFCRLNVKVIADLALDIVEHSIEQEQPPESNPPETALADVDLYVLGAGVFFPQHLTMETIEILQACNRICTNFTDVQLLTLPEDIRSKCQSLWPLYRDHRPRSENYADVKSAIVATVERERPVAWLTRGHPRVFDRVSEALVKEGRDRGWQVHVLPAISCIDTLLTELDYDPGHGLLIHEATGLVAQNVIPSPTVATLLLQPDVFGSNLPHFSSEQPGPDLAPLRDYLLKYYDGSHRCAFVRSAMAAGDTPEISWVRLDALCSVPYQAVAGSTLFLSRLTRDQQ